MATEDGAPYSAAKGAWKSIKDLLMAGAAGIGTVFAINAAGLVQQCPDATVTALGVTISLKALMQFINNYRKNS